MFKFLRRQKSADIRVATPLAASADPVAPPAAPPASAVVGLQVPREMLTRKTTYLHYALSSLREELEAIDVYRQRADDTADAALKAILLHNAGEEIEHAAMLLEWLRRTEPRFDKELKEYLFTDGPITEMEAKAMGRT